jgi:cell filamentation protein
MFNLYDVINSRYTYENSDVIRNKLNIKDENLLKEYETSIVSLKLASLYKNKKVYDFNEKGLKAIHKYLFEEVYDFAGEYRLENIVKENFRFSEYEYIEENITKIMKKIDIESVKKLDLQNLCKFLSEIMTDLNVLHPFREGNGRTIREFIRQIAYVCGYEVNFFDVEYEKILSVSKKAVIDDKEQIELLKNILKKIYI